MRHIIKATNVKAILRKPLRVGVSIILCAKASSAAVIYVDVNSTNAAPPYTSWATAATNIQDAVDAAVDGDQVLVTNGVYQNGGRSYGFEGARVLVDKAVVIQSVNGPQRTWGSRERGGQNEVSAH